MGTLASRQFLLFPDAKLVGDEFQQQERCLPCLKVLGLICYLSVLAAEFQELLGRVFIEH